jgi:hypothetical protein
MARATETDAPTINVGALVANYRRHHVEPVAPAAVGMTMNGVSVQ